MNDMGTIRNLVRAGFPLSIADIRKLLAEHDSMEFQLDALGKVAVAARTIVKHMKERHELGSCCNDVSPTPVYLLEKALKDTDSRICPSGKPGDPTVRCRLKEGHEGWHQELTDVGAILTQWA